MRFVRIMVGQLRPRHKGLLQKSVQRRLVQKGHKKIPLTQMARGTFRLTLERQAKHYPLTYVGSEYQSGHGHGVCGYGNGD